MDEEAATDQNAISELNERKINLSETLDIVETLSEEAQHELLSIAYSTTSNNPFRQIDANEITDELMESGIIVDVKKTF